MEIGAKAPAAAVEEIGVKAPVKEIGAKAPVKEIGPKAPAVEIGAVDNGAKAVGAAPMLAGAGAGLQWSIWRCHLSI